jgi:type I restriction enzyme S subunit
MDALPSDWRTGRLKSVASIRYGLGQPPAELASGVPMIRATDVDAGIIRTENLLRVDPQELPPGRNPYLKAEEIIVVRSGAYTGDSAIVPQYLEGAVAGYDMVATVTRASSRFVAYSLLSKYVLEDQIHLLTLRAAQPHLNAEELGSVILALPSSYREQEMIAAYLNASCAMIDKAVAAKRRQLKTLDALRTTLVYEAVTQGINRNVATVVHDIPSYGHTPKHWKRSKLRYEISIQNGDFASDKLQDDGAHPVLGGNGMMGHTDLSNVDGETVVIGRVGAYCGNAHYVEGRAWVSDNALIVKSRHHARFFCYLFNALNFNAQANNTAQPVITGTKIKNTYVALPPFAEQETICVHLDNKLGEVKKIVSGIEFQIATLTTYRKSLIHECVTGQQRITEADLKRVRRYG